LPKGEGRGEGEENGQIGSDFASTKTVASEKRQKTGAVQDVAENSLPPQYEEASSFHDLLASPSEEDSGSSFAEADAAEPSQVSEARPQPADRGAARPRSADQSRSRKSPDGKSSAFVKDYNVFLHCENDGTELQLTQDGKEGNSYARLEWSPDSQALVAWRMEPGAHKEVYLIQSSPPGGGRAIFKRRPYDLPGDKLNLYEPNVFDVGTRKQIKPKVDRFEHGWEAPSLHWMRDQRHFAY